MPFVFILAQITSLYTYFHKCSVNTSCLKWKSFLFRGSEQKDCNGKLEHGLIYSLCFAPKK